MMNRGISITHYLSSGNPDGVIYAQMSNWSGIGLKIPRNLLIENKNITELQRPGIYFLFGKDESNPDDKIVYVGEANLLIERLIQHLRDNDKSFFETVICFCSKDDNITVSHTKYLEKRVLSQISNSTEFRVYNKKDGHKINLSKMVIDETDTFFDNMKIVLPTLGFNIFQINDRLDKKNKNQKNFFYLAVNNISAESKLTSNGMLVLKGSQMNLEEAPSLSNGYSNIRRTLIQKEIVSKHNSKYQFNIDYEFSSPSAAGATLLGYPVNGRVFWKTKDGYTLKRIEEEQAKESNSDVEKPKI